MKVRYDHEYEIFNQILHAELCFDICKLIPNISGLGAHFFPYFYNLNYSTGIIILNSLLLSKKSNEISLHNYLKKYQSKVNDQKQFDNFEKKIENLLQNFKNILPFNLRHKVAAHRDEQFKHSDFCVAYLSPDYLDKYVCLISNLKKVFCKFSNYSSTDYPNGPILEQTRKILSFLSK